MRNFKNLKRLAKTGAWQSQTPALKSLRKINYLGKTTIFLFTIVEFVCTTTT
jgi:hypothetical protein